MPRKFAVDVNKVADRIISYMINLNFRDGYQLLFMTELPPVETQKFYVNKYIYVRVDDEANSENDRDELYYCNRLGNPRLLEKNAKLSLPDTVDILSTDDNDMYANLSNDELGEFLANNRVKEKRGEHQEQCDHQPIKTLTQVLDNILSDYIRKSSKHGRKKKFEVYIETLQTGRADAALALKVFKQVLEQGKWNLNSANTFVMLHLLRTLESLYPGIYETETDKELYRVLIRAGDKSTDKPGLLPELLLEKLLFRLQDMLTQKKSVLKKKEEVSSSPLDDDRLQIELPQFELQRSNEKPGNVNNNDTYLTAKAELHRIFTARLKKQQKPAPTIEGDDDLQQAVKKLEQQDKDELAAIRKSTMKGIVKIGKPKIVQHQVSISDTIANMAKREVASRRAKTMSGVPAIGKDAILQRQKILLQTDFFKPNGALASRKVGKNTETSDKVHDNKANLVGASSLK